MRLSGAYGLNATTDAGAGHQRPAVGARRLSLLLVVVALAGCTAAGPDRRTVGARTELSAADRSDSPTSACVAAVADAAREASETGLSLTPNLTDAIPQCRSVADWRQAINANAAALKPEQVKDPASTLRALCATGPSVRSPMCQSATLWAPEGLQPNGTPRHLRLGSGRVTESFHFRARDPQTHTTTITLVAPRETRLAVWFDTQEPVRLDLIRDVRRDPWCRLAAGIRRCTVRLPILEARPPGIWTAHVRKHSSAVADITLTITFSPVNSLEGDA